jgi:hypothetical protein
MVCSGLRTAMVRTTVLIPIRWIRAYPALGTPDPTNAIWAAADCDNDGETNGTENTNGTDSDDPCSYTNASGIR